MTTVPGHNIVMQQSITAQDLVNQNAHRVSPEQAAAQQEAGELAKNTTVQVSDESEKLKKKKERDELRKKKLMAKVTEKQTREDRENDPDTPGRLLDTTV
jgi:hypothetical protein